MNKPVITFKAPDKICIQLDGYAVIPKDFYLAIEAATAKIKKLKFWYKVGIAASAVSFAFNILATLAKL